MSKISSELNKAIIDSITGKYSLYIFQILSLMILSRLFSPELFGVLASIQLIILFFQLVCNSGIAPAIVYQESVNTEVRDSLFSLTALLGVVLSIVSFFATPLYLEWLAIDVGLIPIMVFFSILFTLLSIVPLASIQKDAKFIVIAKSEILSEVLSFLVCILIWGMGYHSIALVIKLTSTSLFRFVSYYYYSNKTSIGLAKFSYNIKHSLVIFDFAKFQTLFQVVNFVSRNLDTLLITKHFGLSFVGYYDKSYQLMRYPLQLFTFAIVPALQPILTRYKKTPKLIELEFYRIAYKLMILGVFVSFVLCWNSGEIVFIMFGPQWQGVSPILSVLSVSIPIQMVLSTTGGVYQATGKTKEQLYCGLFSSFLSITAIITGVWLNSINLLCVLLTISFALSFFQCFYMLHKRVFLTNIPKKFFLLYFLLMIPYINLFFFEENHVDNFELVDSLLNIFTSSLVVFSPIFIMLVLYKFYVGKKLNFEFI